MSTAIWLTRADVAERLQVGVKEAGRIMREEMSCTRVGKRLRVTEAALDAWNEAHLLTPGDQQQGKKKRRKPTAYGDPDLWEPGLVGIRLKRMRA